MAFCSKCGAQLQEGASFCPACGTAGPGQKVAQSPAATGIADNVAAALSYIWIIAIIFLLIEPYNKNRFVRFHAFQSLFYAAACFVLWIFIHMVGSVTGGLAWLVLGPLSLLIGLGLFVYWIVLIVKAFNNQEYRAPYIGDLAAKQVTTL